MDIETIIVIGFMLLCVLAAGAWFYSRRGQSSRFMTVDFITEDRRLVEDKMRIQWSYLVPEKDLTQAWFLDADAIYSDEKGQYSMVCSEDSATPYFLGIGVDREERAKAEKATRTQIAEMSCDRAKASKRREIENDKFADTAQIVALGAFALIALLIVIWVLSSDISISLPF